MSAVPSNTVARVGEPHELTKLLEVQAFTFHFGDVAAQVRGGVSVDGVKVFVAKDITDALGYGEFHPNMIAHVKDKWKGRNPITTIRGVQDVWTLTDEGVNFFCFRSDKPRSMPFQEWLAGDVLKQIGETGRYASQQSLPAAVNQLDFLQGMLDTLRQNDARLTRVEQSQSQHGEQLSDVRDKLEDLRSEFDKRVAALVEKPVKEKPAGTESMTGAKARITARTGTPGWVTEEVLTQLDAYKIEPKAYVARGNRHNPDGSIVMHADGTPVEAEPYFVFQIGMVTRRMSEFLSAAERHPADKRKAMHPALPGKPFNLNHGLAKGEK